MRNKMPLCFDIMESGFLNVRERAWKLLDSRKLLHEKNSGDPFFLMLQHNNNIERNHQKNIRKFYGRTFAMRENCLFLNSLKFRSV